MSVVVEMSTVCMSVAVEISKVCMSVCCCSKGQWSAKQMETLVWKGNKVSGIFAPLGRYVALWDGKAPNCLGNTLFIAHRLYQIYF